MKKKQFVIEKLKVAQVAKDDFSDELMEVITEIAEFRDTDPESIGLKELIVSGGTLEELAVTMKAELFTTPAPEVLKINADLNALLDLLKQTKQFQYIMFI